MLHQKLSIGIGIVIIYCTVIVYIVKNTIIKENDLAKNIVFVVLPQV